MFLDRLKIGYRLMLIVAGTVIGIAAVGGYGLYEIRQNLFEDRKVKTQEIVETAYGLLEYYAAEADAGRLSPDEARQKAKESIATLRYGDGGYLWLQTMDGVIVSHGGNSDLVGQDLSGARDSNGKAYTVEMIAKARKGGGFIEYAFPKAGETEPSPKVSYVKGFTPWNLFVASGIYVDDVDAIFMNLLLAFSGVALTILLVVVGVSIVIGRGITRPLSYIAENMHRLAGGDKSIEVRFTEQNNEIGDLSRAMDVFLEKTVEMDRMREEREEAERRAEAEKRQTLLKMAADFEASVGQVVGQVSSAATQMQSSSESMSATAEETTRQAAAVAAASEQASANVQTVASAAEELTGSIGEISRQVAQASQIAAGAVRQAEQTNVKVQGLVETANRIGEVVALITDIADQTNLLALNATIEAARAGDAGKGFAVVASEVKNLANQTAKATEEIGAQIGGIQTATQEAVTAIEAIAKTIAEIDEVNSGIASAVEEQGAATQEIARNVEQAATGTQEVTSNISGVSQAANETGAASDQIRSAATDLSHQSEKLRSEVDRFLATIQAG